MQTASEANLELLRAARLSLGVELQREQYPWDTLTTGERACVLRLAGFSTLGIFGGRGRSEIELYKGGAWVDLPFTVRSRIRGAAEKLIPVLSKIEVH